MASKAITLANTTIERAGAAVKALIPFPALGGQNYMSGGWGLGGGLGGLFGRGGIFGASPGSGYDYNVAAGNLHQNGVIAACKSVISKAMADAPIIMEYLTQDDQGNDKWEQVQAKSPGINKQDLAKCNLILNLLYNPNGHYISHNLWGATVGSEIVNGNGFWVMKVNKAGEPYEIYHEPWLNMQWDADHFITEYWMYRDGKWLPIPVNQVVHFRYALDPANHRFGWSPVSTVLRQIAGDNGAATYHGALLNNMAVPAWIATGKQPRAGQQVSGITGSQLETWITKVQERFSGDGVGGGAATAMPLDITVLGLSPEQLSLDKLSDYYERRICSVLDVPPMVIGLGSGADHMTYSNLDVAQKELWHRCVLPFQRQHAETLRVQYLPLFGLDNQRFRFSYDYSDVEALQEDQNALMTTLENAAGGPVLTPNEARERINLAAVEGGDELRAKETPPPAQIGADGQSGQDSGGGGQDSKSIKRFNPDEPRADDGESDSLADLDITPQEIEDSHELLREFLNAKPE